MIIFNHPLHFANGQERIDIDVETAGAFLVF